MKKIYEDFFNKLDENELDFFKIHLKKVYLEKLRKNEEVKIIQNNTTNYNSLCNSLYNSNWKIKKNGNSLDLFISYLISQGLITLYNGLNEDYYDIFMTKLGVAFLKYIIQQ